MKLTRAQYDALPRLLSSLPHWASISAISFDMPTGYRRGEPGYIRVEFSTGWGNATFDVDAEGNSEQVHFGDSAISAEAQA